jgi:hypothetical protein
MSTIFHILFSLTMLGFIVGMFKPAWIMRNSANPSRRKIAIVAVPVLFVSCCLSAWLRTPEEVAHDEAVAKEKQIELQAEQAKENASEANGEAGKLYTYYKSIDGNQDTPGYNEQQYLRGQLLSRCNVNGKPRGYYGWIEFRTVFLEGVRVKNAETERLYVFAMNSGEHVSAIWRGEENRQDVIDEMHQTCD